MPAAQVGLIGLSAIVVVTWVFFLARVRASGAVKRLALRATLLFLASSCVAVASARGLFARSSPGFQAALGVALVATVLGYLYTTRFCPRCGRMVRQVKSLDCPRCGARLSQHGMTDQPARVVEKRPARGTPRGSR